MLSIPLILMKEGETEGQNNTGRKKAGKAGEESMKNSVNVKLVCISGVEKKERQSKIETCMEKVLGKLV